MTPTSPLIFLPRDILSFVANYFLGDEDQNKKVFLLPYDWRNFLNSSKQYFRHWKKESQLIVVAGSNAERFYKSLDFRDKIYGMMKNPRLQLDLIFSARKAKPPLTIDLQRINSNLRKVEILDYSIIPSNMDVDEVSLYGSKIPDLSCFSHVNYLSVLSKKLNKAPVDVLSLQNLDKLRFIDIANISNYVSLAKLKSLTLFRCESIIDVSCFKNIPQLTLTSCQGIFDVSSLGNVRQLDLSACKNIRDVSALGRVHTLTLSGCENITDLSALEWVHTLRFTQFNGSDVSGLRNIVVLDVNSSPNIADISMLHTVKELNIESCPKIKSLTGLKKLRDITIGSQTEFTSGREIFQQLVKLEMNHAEAFSFQTESTDHVLWQDSEFFLSLTRNLRSLSIACSDSLVEFPKIHNGLCSLTISYCVHFKTLPGLPPSLSYLEIEGCENLKYLCICKDDDSDETAWKYPLYEVKVNECHELRRIYFIRAVFRCSITNCDRLRVVELVPQMAHLKIVQAESFEEITNYSQVVSLTGDYTKENAYVDDDDDILLFGKARNEGESDDDEEDDDDEEEDEESETEEESEVDD
jgi:hypothetical protein